MNPNEMADGGIDERLRCHGCGQVHESARIATTVDGRQMGSHSEKWRRYHEAKLVLKVYRCKRTRQAYLQRIGERRGFEAMAELKAEMMVLWQWKQGQKK